MSKFKEKMKKLGTKVRTSAKKNPKAFATLAAIIVVASGGSVGTAAGIIEFADILNATGQVVGTMSAE